LTAQLGVAGIFRVLALELLLDELGRVLGRLFGRGAHRPDVRRKLLERGLRRGEHARSEAQDLLTRELGLEALRLRGTADDAEHPGRGRRVGVGFGRDLVGAPTGALDLDQLDLAAGQLVLAGVDLDVVLYGL